MLKILKKTSAMAVIAIFFCFAWNVIAEAATTTPLYTNQETGYEVVIEDNADLLSDSEEKQLLDRMKPVTEYGNIAFVTIDYNIYSSTKNYAQHYTDEHFGNESCVLFLIDMDEHEIYIDTKGAMRKWITSAHAYTITDNVYTYASSGDYYGCGYRAFEQIHTLLEGGRIAQPMKYISNVLLAIIIAMLINYFLVMTFSKKHKASTNELMSGIYRKVDILHPQATFSNQTKKYVPRSSSGGGGGGSHSGGGGHSGGGSHSGGGHRF